MISDKIEDFFWKNSEKMIGIQIELSHSWKGSGDIFWKKIEDFVWHISDKVMEIHRKNLKIEDFCGNFPDTMRCIQIQLECYWKRKWRYFLVKLKIFL